MPDPTPETIAARTTYLYGLLPEKERPTYYEIDHYAGMSRGYLSILMSGKASNPTVDTLERYAAVFGCSRQWLIVGVGRAPARAAVIEAVAAAAKHPRGAEKEART